jgi:hypothetical protein
MKEKGMQLYLQLLHLFQFNRFEPEDCKIKETEFAEALITYSGFSDVKRTKMLKRVKRKFKEEQKVCNRHSVPSRLTWGTTSLRNCASLPQAQSKGYHLGAAVI